MTNEVFPNESIQAAIDALPNTGGKIRLGRGIYDQWNLYANKSVDIEGEGDECTWLRSNSQMGEVWLMLGENTRSHVSGIGFVKQPGALTGDALYIYKNRGTVIERCRPQNAGGAGIHVAGGSFCCTLRDNRIDACNRGVLIDGGSSNLIDIDQLLISGATLEHINAQSVTGGHWSNIGLEGQSQKGIWLDDCEALGIVAVKQEGGTMPVIWIGGPYAGQGRCRNVSLRQLYTTQGIGLAVQVNTARGLEIAASGLLGTGTQISIENVPETDKAVKIHDNLYRGTLVSGPSGKVNQWDNMAV